MKLPVATRKALLLYRKQRLKKQAVKHMYFQKKCDQPNYQEHALEWSGDFRARNQKFILMQN